MTEPQEIKFEKSYIMPSPPSERVHAIARRDWERIRRLVGSTIPRRRWFEVLGGVFLGLAGSALLSILTLQNVETLPIYLLPTLWAVVIGGGIVGGALFAMDHLQSTMIEASATDVLAEMDDIVAEQISGESRRQLAQGDEVIHSQFGKGRIVSLSRRTGDGNEIIAVVGFGAGMGQRSVNIETLSPKEPTS